MGAVITWFQYVEMTGTDNSYQVMCKQYIKRQFYRGKLRKLSQGKKSWRCLLFCSNSLLLTVHKEKLERNYRFLLKSSETKDKTHHAGQRGKQKIMGRITLPAAAFKMDTYGERLWRKGSWNNWSKASKSLRYMRIHHTPWKWVFSDISKNKIIICNNVPE